MSCATPKTPENFAAPDTQAVEVARGLVCKAPNAPQRESIARLMGAVLPRAADGALIDIMPGAAMPEGAEGGE